MQIKTRGLALKHRNIGENDRIVTYLTGDLGVIEACARGVKSVRSQLSGPTQLLSYAELCLFKGKQPYYILDSAGTINSFYSLRLDVAKLALAGYFAELTCCISPGLENAPDFLRLLLNTLHLLQEEKFSLPLLKSIFELRALSVGGFMPNLVGCAVCGEYEKPGMVFFPLEGILVCGECFPASPYNREDVLRHALPAPVLAAMRRIVFSELDRLFSFRLSGASLEQLSRITEGYVLLHTEGKFKSLDCYRQLQNAGGIR